jgi:hypothetical protein
MKTRIAPILWQVALLLVICSMTASAQALPDWELLWTTVPDSGMNPPIHTSWMQPARSYTGIAYDKWRDVLYVVNPAPAQPGVSAQPRIHIWDAMTGLPALNTGRSAHPTSIGNGGELPVPLDTIVPGGGAQRGFDRNRFSLFKIDLDDEGRIYACNLVAPLWGVCVPQPGASCDSSYVNQGPFRIWRWDSPTSTPVLAYATLNNVASAVGSMTSSEQSYTRWGDAFDVIGARSTFYPTNGDPPYEVDSVRVYVSGGSWPSMPEWNREVNVILADTRPPAQRPDRDTPGGGKLDLRLAVKLSNAGTALASHGVAATGTSLTHDIWMDSNIRNTFIASHVQHPTDPWPQTYIQPALANYYLPALLTGSSGPISYFEFRTNKFLVVAGGLPTGGPDSTIPNANTTARLLYYQHPWLINASTVRRETPQVGNRILDNLGGQDNYIADVDFRLRYYSPAEDPDQPGTHLILYVLMSNNGIAAYKNRLPIGPIPVELTSFRAWRAEDAVELRWDVAMEQNNHGFEVQRSFDGGKQWQVIGFVPGRGTTSAPTQYRYADTITPTHLSIGSVVYRLRQIDNDGSEWLSPLARVFMHAAPNAVILHQNYPNPFNPSTTIEFQLAEPGPVKLRVFNALGEEAALLLDEHKTAGSHRVVMNAGYLPAGVYLGILTAGGSRAQIKMTLVK